MQRDRAAAPSATGEKLANSVAEIAAVPEPGAMSTLRHPRIPAETAEEFFERVVELAEEFTRLPRDGDVVFGFVAGVYRTDHPTLPDVTLS